ncbi:MAG: SH3 domain-containing protein, partial [Hyphomicrobiales bacterium]|nr:SH3 domain-containing protein [Hyphomicrobiales bacterium]
MSTNGRSATDGPATDNPASSQSALSAIVGDVRRSSAGRSIRKRYVMMKSMQIVVGAAVLIALAVQSAAAQTDTGPSGPPQSDQPAAAPPPGAPPQPGAPPEGPPPGAAPPPGSPPGGTRAAMVYSNVNLRQGPGTNFNVLVTIPAGSPISVAGCSGAWCQVT